MKQFLIALLLTFSFQLKANEPLISNIYSRDITLLNGRWNYIVDPLDNGFYDSKMEPLEKGFFENRKQKNPSERIEYSFDASPMLNVPSDWNTQDEKMFFYEGSVWYKKDFKHIKQGQKRTFIYFGAANYETKVYINGKFAGEHIGGYTPFNFDITSLLNDGDNFVVVRVNNSRHKDHVPTVNMDWWNFGGITREAMLVDLPETYIEDYSIQLSKEKKGLVSGWIKLNKAVEGEQVRLLIPELGINKGSTTNSEGLVYFEFKAQPDLWSPAYPKLYNVSLIHGDEKIADQIGFRTIETKGKLILLNGKNIFLKGICIHEEAAYRNGRAWSKEDALTLLTWAKELGCNFVRLAHYPHNEYMVREAERLGLMIWSEIPVYWTISWDNPGTYKNAEQQLSEMIYRDKNRCGIIVWSIANETPHDEARDNFLMRLSKFARSKDNTRLISMAMEITRVSPDSSVVKDNMNKYVDIISFNQYVGWYNGSPEDCRIRKWEIPYDKPVVVSEFGGDALQGLHGEKTTRWTEEYQEELYIRTIEMLQRIEGLAGTSPWVLKDFLSPRRQLPNIQDWFNRKGLVSDQGMKKKAFYVLQEWYKTK